MTSSRVPVGYLRRILGGVLKTLIPPQSMGFVVLSPQGLSTVPVLPLCQESPPKVLLNLLHCKPDSEVFTHPKEVRLFFSFP